MSSEDRTVFDFSNYAAFLVLVGKKKEERGERTDISIFYFLSSHFFLMKVPNRIPGANGGLDPHSTISN
jgi:hypothetical protein